MSTGDKWILILCLVPVVLAFNWRPISNAFTKICSIALSMGVFAVFFSIVQWSILQEFASWIAGWIQINQTGTITPLICLLVSVGVRAAQIFQNTSDTVRGVLDKIPDPVEWAVILTFGLVGALGMAGSPEWLAWLDAWGEVVPMLGNIIGKTMPLVGIA